MNAHAHLLSRQAHRPQPELTVLDGVTLPLARAHEICGNARHMLALMVASKLSGPVFWITPNWQAETLNPEGMLPLTGPERFTFITVRRTEDLLWTMEETLRSGAVPLVVAELTELPSMTAIRRLHLAAETGAKEGRCAPLGLLLTPGNGGAPGIETRWHMTQAHGLDGLRWTLSRRRARTSPPQSWSLSGRPDDWTLEPVHQTALASG
jgi:protein ImuA